MSCGSVDDFECGNGDCINYSLTCDGMAHCKDKSDEKQSYCGELFNGAINSRIMSCHRSSFYIL